CIRAISAASRSSHMESASSRVIATNGAALRIAEGGAGEPALVFLHSRSAGRRNEYRPPRRTAWVPLVQYRCSSHDLPFSRVCIHLDGATGPCRGHQKSASSTMRYRALPASRRSNASLMRLMAKCSVCPLVRGHRGLQIAAELLMLSQERLDLAAQ